MPRTPIRRTKIVATLGPAWDQPAQMTALLDAGVNVVRINASHGTPEIRARWIEQLGGAGRAARRGGDPARPAGPPDPDRRSARPRSGSSRAAGRVRARGRGRAGEIPTTYDDLASDVRVGSRILLDDGLLSLEVTGVRDRAGRRGGPLRRRAQGAQGDEPARDRGERAGADREGHRGRRRRRVALGVDYIALSLRPPAGGHGAAARAGPARASSWWPRSRRTPRSRTCAASSTPPTRSWSPGATWASSCRSRKCR